MHNDYAKLAMAKALVAQQNNAATKEPRHARDRIVSHPLCPHAHRLTLIATAKGWVRGQDYAVTYLPYATLMQTAPLHSPTGELPVLKVDGVLRTDVTVAAAEYLDGETGLGLIPSDPDLRLTVREREKRVGALLDTMRAMFAGQTAEGVQAAIDGAFGQLGTAGADGARHVLGRAQASAGRGRRQVALRSPGRARRYRARRRVPCLRRGRVDQRPAHIGERRGDDLSP